MKKDLAKSSLKMRSTPRSVLCHMAEDAERAERLRAIKAARPGLRWSDVAEATGVKERTVLGWAKTGALSYAHAEQLAEFVHEDLDWFWRGPVPESPDLMTALKTTDPDIVDRLDHIEMQLAQVLAHLALTPSPEPPPPEDLNHTTHVAG